MTKEEKSLLFKDLCSRLPYGLKCKICLDEYCAWNPEYDKILADATKVKPELPSEIREKTYTLYGIEGTRAILLEFEDQGYGVPIKFIKPFLRSMPLLTEDEQVELGKLIGTASYNMLKGDMSHLDALLVHIYKNHIDAFELIPKGLALEAKEGMYNLKEK